MRTLLILVFLVFYQVSDAQLIDPFGKMITHEIKLNKLKDGTYAGAMEWTTGGLDSLQRFVINGLDIKTPVLVRIISKAPKHNIDLGFYKEKWDKLETKISTDGDKFADKIFRTMSTAGLGVYSEVAGIPYLITVKTGLQFPSTKSLIRVTDDKEEYNRHLRKMGLSGNIFIGNDSKSSNNGESSVLKTENDGNILLYIIIGLLATIIILLGVFVIKKQKSKHIPLLVIVICFSSYTIAQKKAPTMVPVPNQGESPVFYDYRTQNVVNQSPVKNSNSGKDGRIHGPVGIELGSGVKEITGREAEAIHKRIQEANNQFDRYYRANMPGEETEGDQRILTNRNTEELIRLRRQVQQLQQQVELLSQQDEEYEPFEDEGDEILLYCEDISACQNCITQGFNKFIKHRAYFDYLQKFYLKKISDLNDWIEWGNAISSLPGGGGMAWGPIYMYKVKPAVEELKKAYSKKFDEYIESMQADLESVSQCYEGENGRFRSRDSVEAQMFAVINALKASKIQK